MAGFTFAGIATGLAGAALVLLGGLTGWSLLARRRTQRHWRSLAGTAGSGRFGIEMIEGLPEPVQRYFRHAIAPGTPLAASVELHMTGWIRLSRGARWMRLKAAEILAPPDGFVFTASTGGLLKISGADSYLNRNGSVAWRLFGIVPVARASGPDVSRSAQGRLAGELFLLPSALLPQRGVRWEALGDDTVRASFTVEGRAYQLTLGLQPGGAPGSVEVNRWGNVETEGGAFREIAFGGALAEPRTFGGYTIPTRIAAGWRPGSDSFFEFFRIEGLSAAYR
jgi:hypothetical protein